MKLIVIDPHVTRKSPSMRAWVGAFPHVRNLFESVEIWATECDLAEDEELKWVRVPQRFPGWKLHALDFQRRVKSMKKKLGVQNNCVVMVNGCYLEKADIHYIHFWNCALLEEWKKRQENFPLSWHTQIAAKIMARIETRTSMRSNSKRFWWVVSESLAARIEEGGADGHFRILPNQYDDQRFNPLARARYRNEMRAHYGYGIDDKVLVFSAFGHFERKGLVQAVEAVSKVRSEGYNLKLLVLGGSEKTVETFKKNHNEYLEGVFFAGLVEQIECHLAVADGLLFPSHFEAFSLAEIEAAALGLRLYLTQHYGVEMILREPINGRRLPWDVKGMSSILIDELKQARFGVFHSELGEALTPNKYALELRKLYKEVIQEKSGEVE